MAIAFHASDFIWSDGKEKHMSTFDDMVSFIKSAWCGKAYNVPCLVGPAGIGKTAACKQAAVELKEEGLATGKVVTIIASQILPNEVSGITMPVVETKAMEIFDHFRMSSLRDGDILFFDELLEADQLVLSACLTLIESRELMSGRKLPDIMIVAATNPTIKPNMLKENIRQRFLWRRFDLDKDGCRKYIRKTCGFDVGEELVNRLATTGEEYNILTPRSLTKMAQWMSEAKDEKQAKLIAANIDACWNMRIGTKLMEAFLNKFNNPVAQVRRAIRTALRDNDVTCGDLDDIADGMGSMMYDDDAFEQTSMTELMEVLQKLPEWEKIERQLSIMAMTDTDDGNAVNF